jgi:ABC-type branched-subunit amino acid transport system substrate-binding protein
LAYHANQLGYKNVAIVFDAGAGSQTSPPAIKVALKVLGINVVAEPAIPANLTSYEATIQQIIAAKPDAMLMQLQSGLAGAFFNQLRALGGDSIPIIGTDYMASAEVLKAIGPATAAKELVACISSAGTGNAAKTAFDQAYQDLYHHAPLAYSNHFYDSVIVGALAMVSAKSTDSKVYVKSLFDVSTPAADKQVVFNYTDGSRLLAQGKKIKYSGIGSTMIFDPMYHTVTGSFDVVKTAVDGTQTVVATIPGDALIPLYK